MPSYRLIYILRYLNINFMNGFFVLCTPRFSYQDDTVSCAESKVKEFALDPHEKPHIGI